jgi:hypothetical protein
MDESPERRRQKRKKEKLALVFHYAQEECDVHTLDVSRSGALIQTPVSFPSGTLLILECPGLCSEDTGARLLAKVVRAAQRPSDARMLYSGLGLVWVRAYAAGGKDALRDFLIDKLGFAPEEIGDLAASPSGDAVFSFPTAVAQQTAAAWGTTEREAFQDYTQQRERLMGLQKGRFRVEMQVIYSVHNMHYRGTLFALGLEGVGMATRGALPFPHAKVTVRYPLDSSPTAPRVILFCETDVVLEPHGSEAGMFSAHIVGIDELDSAGIFRMHLRSLKNRNPLW